jgi:hypothetical protein
MTSYIPIMVPKLPITYTQLLVIMVLKYLPTYLGTILDT